MIYKTTYLSTLGLLTLASDGDSLIGLWIENQKYHGDILFDNMVFNDNLQIFEKTKHWLDDYFAGKNPKSNDLKIKFIGSDFRKSVWGILCEIPYGEIITYKDIAQKIAIIQNIKTMSTQAVGGAVGHNPISIIVPCHRVVGTNGSLIGYAGGILKKIELLKLEKVNTSRFFIPNKGSAL